MSRTKLIVLLLIGLASGEVAGQDLAPTADSMLAFGSEEEVAKFLAEALPEPAERPIVQATAPSTNACPPPSEPDTVISFVPIPEELSVADSTVVICGRVLTDDGEAIPGAHVWIRSVSVGSVSDSKGQAMLILEADQVRQHETVRITASIVGFTPQTQEVTLRPGKLFHVTTVLKPGIELEHVVVEGYATSAVAGLAGSETITNVQHAGVDEGGIVKVHGDHLVILRRGRLFTVRIGDDQLTPISTTDAFGPAIDPRRTWYDELLVADDFVAVIGYSYQRGGTEIGLFRIDDHGQLGYHSTYQISSNDYYSSRNYATRLIDGRLVLYTPTRVHPARAHSDPSSVLPSMRRWADPDRRSGFEPIASFTRIYRPAREIRSHRSLALHSVTTCDFSEDGLDCEATAVFGPWSHTFYVSPQAVYAWLREWPSADTTRAPAMLYRLPLDGGAPSAIGVSGSPVDQFSFLESDDEHLNVVVRSRAAGQWMWTGERTDGTVNLLRLPMQAFGDGATDAPAESYTRLPAPEGYIFQNRFVGDYLLYGTGSVRAPGRMRHMRQLFVVDWRSGAISEVSLAHGIDRIEPMAEGAVVIGSDASDLHFTSVQLRRQPRIMGRFTVSDAQQGELRSHGFFYRPDDARTGILGLPVRDAGPWRYGSLTEGSAEIVFLRNRDLRLAELGRLEARRGTSATMTDQCQASCVDWYGNARPIFLRGRIFALLGYEIVEGRISHDRLYERRRAGFAPTAVSPVSSAPEISPEIE